MAIEEPRRPTATRASCVDRAKHTLPLTTSKPSDVSWAVAEQDADSKRGFPHWIHQHEDNHAHMIDSQSASLFASEPQSRGIFVEGEVVAS